MYIQKGPAVIAGLFVLPVKFSYSSARWSMISLQAVQPGQSQNVAPLALMALV